MKASKAAKRLKARQEAYDRIETKVGGPKPTDKMVHRGGLSWVMMHRPGSNKK